MKSRPVAAVLALFLGGIGIHKFYLDQTRTGVFYLLFFWTFIPAVLAFFEGISLAFMSPADFNAKFNADSTTPNPLTHVKCPDCRELVFKDARKCKHCGTSLVPQ
jgi:TM2 domain-containing membrane protein YozV